MKSMLIQQLELGKVYRRQDLAKHFNFTDRDLIRLVVDGTLQKITHGLYYFPQQSVFGLVPPEDGVLLKAFLKTDKFLLTSPNMYNGLRVGITQLYNKQIVYNHKRHGEITLNGKKFFFRKSPNFPKKVTVEFLLVDLVNNIEELAEDRNKILENTLKKAKEMDAHRLERALEYYGSVRTKEVLYKIISS